MNSPNYKELSPPPSVGGMLPEEYCDIVLAYPPRLLPFWIKDRNWLAVPIDGHLHSADDDELARLAISSTNDALYAIAILPAAEQPRIAVYQVAADPITIEQFADEMHAHDWFLTDDALSFLVFVPELDHYVVAGTREFITRTCGMSPEVAITKWEDLLAETRKGSMTHWFFYRIFRHYASIVHKNWSPDNEP